jgi:hypothetical protein
MSHYKQCHRCGATFRFDRESAKYCSATCRTLDSRDRVRNTERDHQRNQQIAERQKLNEQKQLELNAIADQNRAKEYEENKIYKDRKRQREKEKREKETEKQLAKARQNIQLISLGIVGFVGLASELLNPKQTPKSLISSVTKKDDFKQSENSF